MKFFKVTKKKSSRLLKNSSRLLLKKYAIKEAIF
jgi:hypothetical protein